MIQGLLNHIIGKKLLVIFFWTHLINYSNFNWLTVHVPRFLFCFVFYFLFFFLSSSSSSSSSGTSSKIQVRYVLAFQVNSPTTREIVRTFHASTILIRATSGVISIKRPHFMWTRKLVAEEHETTMKNKQGKTVKYKYNGC